MANKTFSVSLPVQFEWVIEYMRKWHEEQKTGEIRLVYRKGGITAVRENEYHQPPKLIIT